MKKIVKLFILIFVCFIPVMTDAKANLEFKNDYVDKLFFDEENGEYFYFDTNKDLNETNNIEVYAKNGNFLRRDSFFREDGDSSSTTVPSSKYFDSFYKLYIKNDKDIYNEEDGILYRVSYYSESFGYNDSEGNRINKNFNDDLDFTKRILGKKYDAYLAIGGPDVKVNKVIENNGYYLVYYRDSEYNNYVSVLDKDIKTIKIFESGGLEDNICLYIYDDLIYLMTSSTTIKVYKLDGSLLETLTISHVHLNDTGYLCGDLVPYKLYINNNELFIMYDQRVCYERVESNDPLMEKANQEPARPEFLTLVYSLNYDVNKVETSNGDFKYTSKFDDEGREYVELKISPLKGYSVEDIIVTDINGKRIDVTNNKFYMPASDVTVEVKFGEYIPIPDTFSNMSPVIKVFAVLLIALGMCIMCFNLKSKKAK